MDKLCQAEINQPVGNLSNIYIFDNICNVILI